MPDDLIRLYGGSAPDVHEAALREIDQIVGNEDTLGEGDTSRVRGIVLAALSRAASPAERDALKAEVERLRDGWAEMTSDLKQAEAAIERVRALHTQGVMPDMCKECNHVPAADCPTLRALDTPASPKGAPDDR